MASRRDQLQSYQFLLQRVISALVMRETDPAQVPLRRGTGAVFAGVMIAVIVAAGFGIYGLLTKSGSDQWKTEGAVVVEKESGASFVFHKGRLFPMANYASALLASGSGPQNVFREPHNSLRGVQRGIRIGIPEAPASLPDPGQTVSSPWRLCSYPAHDESNARVTRANLLVGVDAAAGRQLHDNALLVRDSESHDQFLIWHAHRYPIHEADAVVTALFGTQAQASDVRSSFLNALPRGVDIGPREVTGRGSESAQVPGRQNGEVLQEETGSGKRYYIVRSDGLEPITELQKYIEAAVTDRDPTEVPISEVKNSPTVGNEQPSDEGAVPPKTAPTLLDMSSQDAACAQFTGNSMPELFLTGSFADSHSGTPTGAQSQQGTTLADRVVVPPGQIAVVRAMSSSTATTGAYNLVTDIGKRYPVSSADALTALGYQPENAVSMPASLVNRIPAGPSLNPDYVRFPADEEN
ncbi:MAG: type VII secretion protein EccB [Actinocatenispora sp.]